MASPDSAPAATEPAPATPFDRVGGEAAVRALTDRFYDLMHKNPAYAEVRALHPDTLGDSRDKYFWILCGWLGGPAHYVVRFGLPRLRMRHMPFAVGVRERDQWLACMSEAMLAQGLDPELVVRLEASFFKTADFMRNKGG